MIETALRSVSAERIRRDLFHLSERPLPYRKVNHTRSGQSVHTLAETDAYIREQLEAAGLQVAATVHRVQAFRCEPTKPKHHWYAPPAADDPWFEVENLEVTLHGSEQPEEIIQLVSHKDSQSWIDSPGAHDNAVGTVANLELARVLSACALKRTVRILFCNEEHTPWTSRAAADAAAARGDQIIAVMNVDSLDGKPDEDRAAGRMTHTVCYSTEEGRELAEEIASCATRHGIDLEPKVVHKEFVNDDDGMFIKAGFERTVMNVGSFPYHDSQYHLPGDTPDRISIENVVLSTQLILASILEIDAGD